MVSSCAHLPWMMEVWPLRDWLSTAFHTLLRQAEGGWLQERRGWAFREASAASCHSGPQHGTCCRVWRRRRLTTACCVAAPFAVGAVAAARAKLHTTCKHARHRT